MANENKKDDLELDPDSPLGEERLKGADAGEIENLRAEKNALFEKLARAQADFQNSRKRLEADLETRVQYQLSKLIESQLPLIDNLERAIGVDPAKAEAATILKGVGLVHDQWIDLLKRFGVETIAPKPGDAFDPHVHQAVMHEPSDQPEGTVARLAQTGYALNGKLVRSALVVVAKAK
ncbi:MAG: nucleotide exchange factor GrpE [Tepidisphaeraceae bacterium]